MVTGMSEASKRVVLSLFRPSSSAWLMKPLTLSPSVLVVVVVANRTSSPLLAVDGRVRPIGRLVEWLPLIWPASTGDGLLELAACWSAQSSSWLRCTTNSSTGAGCWCARFSQMPVGDPFSYQSALCCAMVSMRATQAVSPAGAVLLAAWLETAKRNVLVTTVPRAFEPTSWPLGIWQSA